MKSRPQADCVIIAQRSALRVAGNVYIADSFNRSHGFEFTALASLRSLLTAAVAGVASTPAVRAAAIAAAGASDATASYTVDAVAAFDADIYAVATANSATATTAYAAATAYAANIAGASITATFAAAAVWKVIRADALALQAGTNPLTLRLWHRETPPNWFTTTEANMRAHWATNPTQWSFWQRWYDAAIAGRPLDWQLQHDIALIPNDIWQSGPGPVAEAIAKIEAENNQRPRENPLTTELRNLPKPSASQIATTQAAMEQNRTMLPPTFDAIEGLILLEIERLQRLNYKDDLEQAEAHRQIRIFITLYEAICALRAQLPATGSVSNEQAEQSIGLINLYAKEFAGLPRKKAPEVVEGVWSVGAGVVQVGLIAATSSALMTAYALPYLAGIAIGSIVFARKSADQYIKAARDALPLLGKG